MKNRNISKYFLGVIILNLLLFYYSLSQNVNFLNNSRINQGARLSSLAGSFIADDYETGIMYFNPAGLSYLKNYLISINHYQERSINAYSQGLMFPIYLGVGEGIAFSLNTLHTGYIKKNPTHQLKFQQFAYNVAYSREIFYNLSLGGIFGFQYTRSNYNNLWTYRTSVGFYYVPSEEISYSILVGEIGSGIKYSLSDTETILQKTNLHNGLQLGITMRHPISLIENLYSISLSSEKVFNERGARYKTGCEVYPFKFLSLRAGYYVSDDLKYSTFGFGLKLFNFLIDASYYPNKINNNEFYLTLSYKVSK